MNTYNGVAVWCSGNALILTNAVALHRARLVLGWMTAYTGRQGRSQPRRSGGAPASGRGAQGWVRTNLSPSAAGVRGSRPPPPNFLYILNTKSRILMHSLAPKMGWALSVYLSRPLCIGGNEDCWRRLLNEARRAKSRPKAERGVGFLGRGQQATPARRPGSDVNKTKFLRSRPK